MGGVGGALKTFGEGLGKSIVGLHTGAASGFISGGPLGAVYGGIGGTIGGATSAATGGGWADAAKWGAIGGGITGVAGGGGLTGIARGATGGVAGLKSGFGASTAAIGAGKAGAGIAGMTLGKKLLLGSGLSMLGMGLLGGRGGPGEIPSQDPLSAQIESARIAETQRGVIEDLARRQELASREIAGLQRAERDRFLNDLTAKMSARRAESVAKLQSTLAQQSKLAMPALLEDLNTRGLLTSETAVARALAEQEARNNLQVQQYSIQQEAVDRASQESLAQQILEANLADEQEALAQRQTMEQAAIANQLQLEFAGLQRGYSIQDINAQNQIARQLAEEQANAARQQGLIYGGTTLLGSLFNG